LLYGGLIGGQGNLWSFNYWGKLYFSFIKERFNFKEEKATRCRTALEVFHYGIILIVNCFNCQIKVKQISEETKDEESTWT
jgi:hypothetical protein